MKDKDVAAAPSIILITDARYELAHTLRVIEAVANALPRRRSLLVQLRDKGASVDALQKTAHVLAETTATCGAMFVVNAPTDEALRVACEVGADGAHVPCTVQAIESVHHAWKESRMRLGSGVSEPWLSTPAHSDDDVRLAIRACVTAVLVSPIWPSPGKGPPRGVGAIAAARDLVLHALPLIYALGGVDAARASDARHAGANGVAVVRALFDHDCDVLGALVESACALDAPFH